MALRMLDGHGHEVERSRPGHNDSGFHPISNFGCRVAESMNGASNKVGV